MTERSIAWLVPKNNRLLRNRGVERNEAWLHRRVSAPNLRRLVVLGSLRTYAYLATTGSSASLPALRCGLTLKDPTKRYVAG